MVNSVFVCYAKHVHGPGKIRLTVHHVSVYGQGSQKLYNWQNMLSPPHYRNGIHHPVEIVCLYCGETRDV